MRTNLVWMIMVVAVLSVACTTSFKQLHTSYAPYDKQRPVQVYPRLTGQTCEWWLFGAIPVGGDGSVNTAISKMTRGSAKIDNLVGMQVEGYTVNYLVVSKKCVNVSGYPVIYKDTEGKWELFDKNMMDGKLVKKPAVSGGGNAAASSQPTTGTVSGRTTGKTKTKTHRTEPRVKVEPRKSSVPSKTQCETTCSKFARLWKGSDAIRSTIRGQCVTKCLKPENNSYRNCIKGASKIDDIARCNSI
jgi:hypothetical protein